MGKVIATVGVVVGAVALAATGIGAIAAPALAGSVSFFGVSASTLLLAGTALQAVGQALIKRPEASTSTMDRLNASLVTDTPRKIAFGRTALNTDLRYQEWWGANQEYCSQVFVVASHWCESIDEIWLDDKLAWSSAGGVAAPFAGYLVVQPRPQATSGLAFAAGWSGRWGVNASFAGCATLYLQFKVTGNGKKATSPFASSITSRVTVVGKGARLPDPRFDSTAGGSGAVRVSDQSTWAWAPQGYEVGRNPALALLFYLVGWRIQNPQTGTWTLAVGRGIPVDRIDLDSFITAANLCDEPVTRADGSIEPRYRCDGTFSEGDDPPQVIAGFEACMNAKLRDSTGRFSLQILHNDLATPVVDFTDDDVLGDFTWTAGNNLNDRKNLVRGRYVDPSALYQLVDFPAVRLASLDGIDRIDSVDLGLVQSPSQAQRLAKQRLQRMQYPGAFGAEFNARGWAVKDGDIVRLTFSALGFDRKLFRVAEGLIDPTGVVPLVLVEEHADIYAWDQSETAAVQAAEPNRFDPLLLPLVQAIDDAGKTAEWPAIVGEGKPEDYATNSADPNSPFGDSTVKEAVAKLDRIVPIETRFGPIETDVSALKDASVEADAALSALTGRVDDSASDISALKDADAKTAEALADLGGAVADQDAAQRQVDESIGRIEEGLLRTLLESARTRDVLRDAGIVVDPATGQVRIYAVDQLKDRTASAEVAIDGVKGLVATKASVNFVQEQIALAVLDPGQVAELEPIIARLTQAESAIDGLNAAVTLKASVAELTALAARTRTAEIDIDAMKGVIALKANADVVDQIGLRTSEIEQTLTALPDTAGLVVSVRQARGAADGSADAMLRSLLSGETAAKYQVSQLAQARQELSTRMDDGFSAAAVARTALSAKVDAASALALTEAEASVTRDAALTRQLTAQGLVLDGQTAAIGRLDEARIDAAGGIAGAQMTIRQMRGAAGESDEALLRALAAGETSAQTRAAQLVQIQTDFTTTLIADKAASAIAQQAILARMGAAEAAIVTTSKVLADTTGAYGSRINALELAYADPVSGQAATQVRINAVERGSAEADAALGERIDSVDAIVNDALTGLPATRAQLSEGLKTAADRNSALVEQFEELRAELDDPNTGLAAAMATIIANKAAQVAADKVQTERIDAQGVVLDDQVAAIGRIDRALIDSAGGIAGTQMTIRQVTAAADTDAEALLRSMAAGEIAGQTRAAQLVQIQTEFTTRLIAGELSEATARQALLARMGLAEAAIVSTSKAVADAQKAFTSRQDALEAAFNDAATGLAATRARIIALEDLTAEQNRVTVERLDLMDAQLLDPTTGKPISGATIAADRKAAADADSARVTDIAQLRGDVFDGPSGLPAVSGRIDRERELSLQRDNALGIDVDRLAVEIHDPDDGLAAAHASIAAERQASVTRDNANAQAVQQVTARLDGIGGVGVEQSIETVVDRLGVIEGRYTVTIDANGNLTGFQLIGSDAGPGTLNLINTDLRMGTGRIVLNTGSFMQVQGLGFGKDSDLIEWFGPTMAISQCSRANGVTYKTLTGIAYFGGGLAAGVIKNAVQTTDTAFNAVLDSGVFGSNGRSRRVVVSYNWSRVAEIPRAQAAGNGTISAQLLIYRGSTQIGELNVGGKWTATAYGGSSNPARYEEDMGGAVTVNDNFGGTSVVYRVVLATRTLGPGPASAPSFDSQAQVISLIQTEE
ncbi:hypothetical protein SAQ01S_07770 [Sphingomonas aquatilis NBRC 16722]|uniref:DUF1983 domain-containing protein n=1 Tax=Sphingomonas aquatilis TaxID=93063 RepID=A0AAW3TQ93_9SPHN|nr:hypothetical protein [Sphingomonas aquatilis]MBB3875318.1 hypothetical protein [Sphingomonas aquatilis]GEM71011.1 hypothetical protein SAQ01S_07770 [Sphingomonas aquatilis NBRC 16722]